MDKSKLEEYALIKQQISALEEKADELRPGIIDAMVTLEAEKVNTDWGTFTIQKNRKWSFSEGVEGVRTELKEKEAKEKADGTATYEETPVLKFTSKKDKGDILG